MPATGSDTPPSGDACKAAGGTCTSQVADVVCKSQPVGLCKTGEMCCVM